MAEYHNIRTPLGELMYVNISGKGVQNYDGDGYEYKASIKLPKKQAKKLEKEILDYFNENKPSSYKKDEPSNKIMQKLDDGDYLFTFKTKTEFADKDGNVKKVKVRLYNAKNEEKELPDGTLIGNGSKGVIRASLKTYTNGKGKSQTAGVSMFLNAIQLAKFVPYVPDSGFDEIEDGEFEDFDNQDFPTDEKPKKSKKKKKKSKE